VLTAARDLDLGNEAVLKVYEMILSWPCRHCGQPFPCEHDREGGAKLRLTNKYANIGAAKKSAPKVAASGARKPVR